MPHGYVPSTAYTTKDTNLTKGKRVDGSMFSCTSLGLKIGGGLVTVITGWLLDAAGYIPNAAIQFASALNMLNFMYLWVPMLISILITVLLARIDVEKANATLMETK